MNFNELAEIWHSQDDQPLVINEEKVVEALRKEHRKEEKLLLRLNIQEISASLLLFLFFGYFGFVVKTGQWAFFSAAILCLGIGLFMFGSTRRQRRKESSFGDSVKDQLGKAISQAKHREWLYCNIFWWYLLPCLFGWGVVTFEIMLKDGVEISEIIYLTVCFIFFAWVYRANRRIAINKYVPRRKQLEAMLQDLESENE